MARILVIDDEPSVRDLLNSMLSNEGYEVMEAANGEMAIKLLHERPADLVVTDLIMPEKEGIETIMDLRRDFPDVKIIAMSGGGIIEAQDYLGMALGMGAHRVFEKPFRVADMLNAVRELLALPRKGLEEYGRGEELKRDAIVIKDTDNMGKALQDIRAGPQSGSGDDLGSGCGGERRFRSGGGDGIYRGPAHPGAVRSGPRDRPADPGPGQVDGATGQVHGDRHPGRTAHRREHQGRSHHD